MAQAQTVQTQTGPAVRDQQVRQVHHPFQAIGLTKAGRRGRSAVLLDLSFDARAGQVTVLLGPEGSGRTTALRLALGLERGQGTALFHGRPYRRLSRPEREVGVVLGEADRPAGHPGRRARAHLRMMAAAAGVSARRADQLLEQTRLAPAAEHRLRTYSPGMNRRLQLAQALLGDPSTLLLDEPTEGLSPKNVEWFHAFLRAFAAGGGAVLVTLRSPQQAAQLADRVVTLELGRLMADQPVEEFRRTRLRDEVSVRGPQVARLADLLAAAGAAVRHEGGNVISVEGLARTEIGELAFQHGILLHELADRVVEHAPAPGPRPPEPAGASLAKATVALGPGETVTTQVVVPTPPAPGGHVLPARRETRVLHPLLFDEDD
ncbi:ATP-binding cassette domain-containing protein [Streptacidiphilus neutrinimicus]|uniref:ATP-binding cassette domain-containing protein n=1 Tax=Streptacidiphilus neutrinimicus TaxID=105420 RepID=UPI000693E3B7|nr:ABC transporter ATP-binding protein [Streptacidiphilus neutrinimicus]